MFEVELKFQVPVAACRGVDAALAPARAMRLQAIYFDTPDRRLAQAGLALRLRKQGRRWVQTLKAGGPGALRRLEHEVILAVGTTAPAVDPARHAGTPAGDRLAAALAPPQGGAPPLVARYRIDVRRRARCQRTTGGEVEIAFDRGAIVADGQRLGVSELEIELVGGSPRAVLGVARRWVRRHGLWLDVRSKAERGDRLARRVAQVEATRSGNTVLNAEMDADAARRALVATCLQQILANASELAGGCGSDEHVHQLRVGLRRLRSTLRFFRGWAADLDPALDERIAVLFRGLGAARDRDALAQTLQPALRDAGAPLFELPPAPAAPSPAELARDPATTLLWLDLLGLQFAPAAPPRDGPGLAAEGGAQLQRWHRRVVRAGSRYAELDDVSRHRLRKRAKRLRYAAEAMASLSPGSAAKSYLARLAPVQDALGRYNDLCVALAAYRAAVGGDPRAWFAIGWLTARRDALLADCIAALKRFARAEPFWIVG